MLLALTNRTPDATDLGHLLHKHPARVHETALAFGTATVFYPKATENECTAILSVDVDPVGLVRSTGGRQGGWSLGQYVNDRPYTASSFLATAISRTFGTALNGRCTKRPELVNRPLDLEVTLPVIHSTKDLLKRFFEPLGYTVETTRLPFEPKFPDWGDGHHATLRLYTQKPLHQVLRHLFVLVPALDRDKHYWIGSEEIDKLLAKGEGWLGDHPEREWIVRRYLKYQNRLTYEALDRLAPETDDAEDADEASPQKERRISLHEQRLEAVAARLAALQPQSVVDLGCGEGKLVRRLVKDTVIPRVLGMDVSSRALGIARDKLDRLPAAKRDRAQLIVGSLIYRDSRLAGFDAAALVEVIEHLDPDRLEALEQVVFAHAAPRHVLVTTPNREYNVLYEGMQPGTLRHADHRFEWTRAEFETWALQVAADHGFEVTLEPLGEVHPDHGAPSQMAVFRRLD